MLELLKTTLGSKITQEVKNATAHLNGSFFEEDDKSNLSDPGGAGGLPMVGDLKKVLDRKLDKRDMHELIRSRASKKE
jgi:hypothetical protein